MLQPIFSPNCCFCYLIAVQVRTACDPFGYVLIVVFQFQFGIIFSNIYTDEKGRSKSLVVISYSIISH